MKSEIKSHSLESFPNECCGLVLSKEKESFVYKCKNIAKDTVRDFRIDPEDYLKGSLLGKVIGYYHSHTNENDKFSPLDKLISDQHELPLIMYYIKNNKFFVYGESNG